MKQICLLGSSHVGCIKLGAEAAGAAGKLDGYEITVFGSAGTKLQYSVVENGLVRATDPRTRNDFKWTSGGKARVRLARYDEIYLFAGLPPTCLDAFLVTDPVSGVFDLPPMTDQMVAKVFQSLHEMWHIKLAEDIAATRPGMKVKFVGRPFEAESAPVARQTLRRLDAFDKGFAARVARIRKAMDAHCAKPAYDNLEFVRPPAHLLEKNGLFTLQKYTRGSLRLAEDRVEHPEDDYSHMNAEYGEAMLLHLLGLDK